MRINHKASNSRPNSTSLSGMNMKTSQHFIDILEEVLPTTCSTTTAVATSIYLENRSFKTRENLYYLKTASLILFSLYMYA